MPASLALSLQITLVGMSLVFAAILLLCGLMVVLVRLTAERQSRPDIAAAAAGQARAESRRLLEQAAAAAVAVALARSPALRGAAQPPTAIVSAWQAVMRANRLRQRGPVR